MKTLFPKAHRPYYIVTPSYTHTSSGIRTLHLLCHALNEAGQKAFLVPSHRDGFAVNPNLNTPAAVLGCGVEYIVVYPDIVIGNPLNAKHVVRYLLAPAGAYGGDKEFPPTDQIWGALPSLAENVLRLPVSDPGVFYPPYERKFADGSLCSADSKALRSGSCFYAHKYDRIHGNALLPITENSTRLEGSLEQIADILRRSEVCYLYELSSVITEAALCGCPVTLVRTPYFGTIDPQAMMGNVRWNDGEIVKECADFKAEYDKIVADFWPQLDNFIKKTQEMV